MLQLSRLKLRGLFTLASCPRSSVVNRSFQFFSSTPQEDDTSDLFIKNQRELREMGKEIFTKVDQYSLKKKFEVFVAFASYGIMDRQTYESLEKEFVKNVHSFTAQELVLILEKLVSSGLGSEKFFGLIQSYFIRRVHNITSSECTRLAQALAKHETSLQYSSDESFTSTSKRLCESMHLCFINKLDEFSHLQKLHTLTALLQLMKSRRSIFTESLELVFERMKTKIPLFTRQELIAFAQLYFSHFLPQRQQALQSREAAQDSVNAIMRGGSATENFAPQHSQLFESEKEFEEINNVITSRILEIATFGELTARDYLVICEAYKSQKTNLPSKVQRLVNEFVNAELLMLSPKEIYRLYTHVSDKSVLPRYLKHYEKDIEYSDILSFFKTVLIDREAQSYKESLRIVGQRAITICPKWELDECVYLLCAREDQEILALKRSSKESQVEREAFIEAMMKTTNSELKMRKAVGFKVISTVWKLLFRSGSTLESSYSEELLENMRLNMQLLSLTQFLHVTQILSHIIDKYPHIADSARLTLITLEQKYAPPTTETIEQRENEKKKLE